MSLLALLSGGGNAPAKVYIEDVFLVNIRSGTGASASITGGPNMSGSGGMHVTKARSTTTGWRCTDTTRGATKSLDTSSTAAEETESTGLTAFNTDGATIGADADYNASGQTFVDYFLRDAAKFFKQTTVTKSAGSNATVDLSILGTVGMVKVKRTDSTGSWYVWHRSLTAGKLLIGETTAAEATLGHITVSGTTLTLVNGVIADGTYHVEAYANDTSADGLIQCGSFTTDGSGNATVTLGWEPQFVMAKSSSATSNWEIVDVMRGASVSSSGTKQLWSNLADAEGTDSNKYPTATGFVFNTNPSTTYIYLAIRRPNKPPTTGAQVYNAVLSNAPGASVISGAGFAPDMLLHEIRSGDGAYRPASSRLTGAAAYLATSSALQEVSLATGLVSWGMDGVSVGSNVYWSGLSFVTYFFRRAPGFMDVVCDTGTGSAHTVAHNLTAAPELLIRKSRSGATQWEVWHSALATNEKLVLNSTAAKVTDTTAWNSTAPTASVFTVGTGANVNTNAATYVTYLFATLAGISKVFSYTGNGTSQTINCGFAAGARFIMLKRTDAAGDWFLWDTVRGVVAGNDPHLSLNTTAAEVTTNDSIDPDASGFIVNQVAATNINVNAATYIGFAIA